MIEAEALNAAAAFRLDDLLNELGAEKVRGSAERGRATCPIHHGDSLSVAYSNGFVSCHSGCGRSWDPIGLVRAAKGLDFREAAEWLEGFTGTPSSSRPAARRSPQTARPVVLPSRDVPALWHGLALRDPAGELYLAGRKLLP